MKAALLRIKEVDQQTVTDMYDLFLRQFESITLQDFTRDLMEKNWLLLLRMEDDSLAGFSSMHVYCSNVTGKSQVVVFSGDTVVDDSTWSDSALSYYWMGAIDYLRRKHRADKLLWFLLVSGYRTYRFLPVYSKVFYPCFKWPTPDPVQQVMNKLARQRFQERYNEDTGIVRLEVPAVLKHGFRGIPESRLKDPHIAFFAEINPGHDRGDELVCFTEISTKNLTRLGTRMWKKGREFFPDDDQC